MFLFLAYFDDLYCFGIANMSFEDEIYVTSRSRAPSLIDVTSQNERVFAELPDLIQEAAVSTECMSRFSGLGVPN